MRAVLFLLIALPALARDPITGIEDSHDLQKSRLAAMRRQRCKSPRKRSYEEKRKFRSHFPCPSTDKHSGACPGWVVDHVVALKHCGPDKSTNMAWQTTEDARAKDRFE